MTYEVEIKIELARDEKLLLQDKLKEKKLTFNKTTPQKDYYIEANKSPYYDQGGSYDIKRYRNENGAYFYTSKIWEMVDGNLARQEEESELSEEDFNRKIEEYPNAIKIQKSRDWYWGKYKEHTISVTIDSVKFDHSIDERYFIEAEITIEDKAKNKEIKDLLSDYLKELLEKDALVESPGMLKMAFEKK